MTPSRGTHAYPGRRRARVGWLALALLVAAPAWAHGQEPAAADSAVAGPNGTLRVFLDCTDRRICDFDFFRREIPFVDYVRNRQDADVHVLITSQSTGAGGRSFTLDFLGRGRLEGVEDRLTLSTPPEQAEEETLERLSRSIELGLARYVARTPAAERIRLVMTDTAGEAPTASTAEDDAWNFWVFRATIRGEVEAEDRSNSLSGFARLSANRVTEALKIELSVDGEYEEENFEVDDTTTVTSIQRNYEVESLAVWSLGGHWSAGAEATLGHSDFRNRQAAVRLAPALEYNLFRYDESERQQLTFLYSVGLNRFDWQEETIFGRTSETRVDQSLRTSLAVKQPWGEAGGEVEARTFLDDLGRNRVDARAFVSLRLFRGLSLDLSGEASRIRDQINLPAGDATEEEILLEIRELQTGFEYEFSFGFSYTFGSIFNNVVNPRFEAGRGGFF